MEGGCATVSPGDPASTMYDELETLKRMNACPGDSSVLPGTVAVLSTSQTDSPDCITNKPWNRRVDLWQEKIQCWEEGPMHLYV